MRSLLYSVCLLSLMSGILPSVATAETAEGSAQPERIVVIKADDLRKPNEKWKRFVQLAEDKDIKVSVGIIAYGFPRYDSSAVQWAREQEESGRVEFWNHGWDHNRWKDEDGRQVSEFSKSGYEHQEGNLKKSQKKMVEILGHPASSFGSPFNAMDADTIAVLESMPELEGIFSYHNTKLLQSTPLDSKCMLYMFIPGENDGTGKPNFEKFKEKYASRQAELSFTALQFHPPYFSEQGFAEFEKIIDFLKEEGWTFMLPSDYINWVGAQDSAS